MLHFMIAFRPPPQTFVTTRLRLCAARPEHAIPLFREYTGREEAARYLQRYAHSSPAQTLAVLEECGEANWLTNNQFAWTIVGPGNQVIGLFLMFVKKDAAEIHYGIGPSHWGQGFATEAGQAIVDWVKRDSNLSEVTTCCAAEHTSSLKVLGKMGLHRVELLSQHLLLARRERKVDAWLYRWNRHQILGEIHRAGGTPEVCRNLTGEDTASLIRLWRETWICTYGPALGQAAMRKMLSDLECNGTASMLPGRGENGYCLASDGEILGTVIVAERGDTAYVWGMYIHPNHQRMGLGTKLLCHAIAKIEAATKVEIRVLVSSSAAVRFYEKQGFAGVGTEDVEILGTVKAPALVMEVDTGALLQIS